jgi:hypothetical protein
LSEEAELIFRLLKNKGFKDERMTQVGLCAIGTSATLESNKSLKEKRSGSALCGKNVHP